jgi:hypothetical protein
LTCDRYFVYSVQYIIKCCHVMLFKMYWRMFYCCCVCLFVILP